MTADLKYLAFTAILTAALWIPYVISQVMTNGPLAPPNSVDPRRVRFHRGASVPTAFISMRWNALHPLLRS
jgi:hypothetical protein